MFNVFYEKDGKPDYVVVDDYETALAKKAEFTGLGYKNVVIGRRH